VGALRTGIGDTGINFWAVNGANPNARLRRYGGTNSNLELLNEGTGDFYVNLNGATRFTLNPNRLAFFNGGGTSVGINALWGGSVTGSPGASYHYMNATVANDVSTGANGYASVLTTANSASPVTLTELVHFVADPLSKGTNTTITSHIGFSARASITTGTNNYGFYGNIAAAANRFNFYAAGDAANYFAGTIASLGSYNATTSAAVNMTIDSGGNILRSTSSIRYKSDVEDLESQYADDVVFGARPVWYRSTCEADNPGWGFYGLIAEELAEIDPRLVHWGRPSKRVLLEEAREAVLDSDGNVLESAREEQWVNAEDTDAPLQPEGVAYDRLTVMLIDVVQRQQQAIAELQEQMAALSA
jgi:hypothetical protein